MPPGARARRGRAAARLGKAIALLALGMAGIALTLGAGRVAAAPRTRASLTAGAAIVDVDVPSGTPLGGYGAAARRLVFPDLLGRHAHAFWFTPHDGVRDRVAARALVFEHRGTRLVWLTADLVAVDRTLTVEVADAIRTALGGTSTVLLSASHTHSGPGAFVPSEVMAFVAMDRHDAVVRRAIVRALVEAARRADSGRVPAVLGMAAVTGPDIIAPRLTAPLDRTLVVLRISRVGGRPIAALWNFAIHPTVLGPRNLALSGDVTGLASRTVERSLGVPALYVNGAVADVSPRRHGAAALEPLASDLGNAIRTAWSKAVPRAADGPTIVSTTVTLPAPRLSLRNCVGGWVPRAITIPASSVLPRDATLTAVRIGQASWVTVPGELQSALGVRIRTSARSRQRPFIAGLTNDYLGYFAAADVYDHVGYVTCASLYGADGGERLAEAAAMLLERLGEAQREGEASRRARDDFLRAAVLR
jgi:hypothetical protein